MDVLAPSLSPTDPPSFKTIGRTDRRRLSAPALRVFRNIADVWGMSERERLALLGEPARSTYYAWLRKATRGEDLTLPLDVLMRISGVFGIYKALQILFPLREEAEAWFNASHAGTIFRGMSPRMVMVEGGLDGILTVRRYLDAWRGGLVDHGGHEGDVPPIDAADLVFL